MWPAVLCSARAVSRQLSGLNPFKVGFSRTFAPRMLSLPIALGRWLPARPQGSIPGPWPWAAKEGFAPPRGTRRLLHPRPAADRSCAVLVAPVELAPAARRWSAQASRSHGTHTVTGTLRTPAGMTLRVAPARCGRNQGSNPEDPAFRWLFCRALAPADRQTDVCVDL
jgi:hypothetical protein